MYFGLLFDVSTFNLYLVLTLLIPIAGLLLHD